MKTLVIRCIEILKAVLKKIPGVAQFARNQRVRLKLSKDVTFKKELGFKFNGPALMECGKFEPDETYVFEALIENFDCFVNIGANAGYYVLKALNRNIETIAFEPNELNIKLLLRNINANKFLAQSHIFPLALSDFVGVVPIYGASTGASLVAGWAGQEHHELVPVSTFDLIGKSIVKEKSPFILIDIEGAEFSCLKGARETLLENDKSAFMVEICTTEHQPGEVVINPNLMQTFELFFSYGFLAYTATRSMRRVSLDEVRMVIDTRTDSFGTHNFLFIKNEKLLEGLL